MGLSIAVGIATRGRAEILGENLAFIQSQTRKPDRVIICPSSGSDLLDNPDFHSAMIISGNIGSTFQRNAIIEAAAGMDVLLFLDDDFLMHPSYIAELLALFERHADIAIATGTVIADGVTNAGISVLDAQRLLEGSTVPPVERIETVKNGYGCNLAVRVQILIQNGIRFDESLPLYAWLEDVDFSSLVSRFGRIVQTNKLLGVHLGTKNGRTSGVKFGYSQIANPIYMLRKGTMSGPYALRSMTKNVVMNISRSLRPEPWVDRRGRLKGNVIAAYHLLCRKISPDWILKL